MSMSTDRPASGRGPSRVRSGALAVASWTVWALWLVCVVFVAAVLIEAIFDVGGALF